MTRCSAGFRGGSPWARRKNTPRFTKAFTWSTICTGNGTCWTEGAGLSQRTCSASLCTALYGVQYTLRDCQCSYRKVHHTRHTCPVLFLTLVTVCPYVAQHNSQTLRLTFSCVSRRTVYEILKEHDIPTPPHITANRNLPSKPGVPPNHRVDFSADNFHEFEDYVEVNGIKIEKPFVEKPADAENRTCFWLSQIQTLLRSMRPSMRRTERGQRVPRLQHEHLKTTLFACCLPIARHRTRRNRLTFFVPTRRQHLHLLPAHRGGRVQSAVPEGASFPPTTIRLRDCAYTTDTFSFTIRLVTKPVSTTRRL